MQELPFWSYEIPGELARTTANEIIDLYRSGKPVYVKIIKEGARQGSIARLAPGCSMRTVTGSHSPFYGLDLEWDGREKTYYASYSEIVWLKGYTGPTVWVFEKNKPKTVEVPKEVFDCIGHPISVGDVVLYTRGYKVFGNVTKITSGGTVYYKIIKVRDDDSGSEHKAYKPSDMLVIRDGLKKDLMYKRLIME